MQDIRKEYDNLSKIYDKKRSYFINFNNNIILKNLQPSNKKLKILDIACGTGILIKELKKIFPNAHITGIDISEGMIKKANNRLKNEKNIKLLNQNFLETNFKKQFDFIFCIASAHFIENKYNFLKNIKKSLKNTGKIYIIDYLSESYFKYIIKVFDLIYGKQYPFSENSFKEICNNNGFKINKFEIHKIRYFIMFYSEIYKIQNLNY